MSRWDRSSRRRAGAHRVARSIGPLRDGARAIVDGRRPSMPDRARQLRAPDGPRRPAAHAASRAHRRSSARCSHCTTSTTVDEAIAIVNTGTYGNQASLFTTSGASARKFRYEAEVGNVGINVGVAAPMAFFPFSGARDSFFGDLHGQGRDAVRVLHPGEGRRRALAERVDAQVLSPGNTASKRNTRSHT